MILVGVIARGICLGEIWGVWMMFDEKALSTSDDDFHSIRSVRAKSQGISHGVEREYSTRVRHSYIGSERYERYSM